MQSLFSNFSQLWVFLTGLCTFLSFSESSACPQVGSANLPGVLAGFPELWIPALYKRMHLCPALGCSVSPILMGLGVTAQEGGKGSLSYRAVQSLEISPELSPPAEQNHHTFVFSLGALGFPVPSSPPSNSFQTRSVETAKPAPNCPTSFWSSEPSSLTFDRNIGLYQLTVQWEQAQVGQTALRPHSDSLNRVTTVLMPNKCLPNAVERTCSHHWYAVLMDLGNERPCIAAFLRQVLYLINAVHKLYNYTSMCHCQIYTLLHTVRLRWFHFIALQMDFWKDISLNFLCSTDKQSTWETWSSLCKCSTCPKIKNMTPANKFCTLPMQWPSHSVGCSPASPSPRRSHHFRTNSTGLGYNALWCLLIWPTSSSLMGFCLH